MVQLLPHSNQMLPALCLLLLLATLLNAEENRTDEAEFRQGAIGQQLGYPVVGGLYGNQYASTGSGGGYVNMLRNLYRPPSLGLTDKVKHWVKSFMNRRQYVKPYYAPSVSGLHYSPEEFGAAKPVFAGGNGYKAISVPLRQLQKYYKPYYAATAGDGAQFLQPQQASGGAASSSVLSYSPGGALYAADFSGPFAPGSAPSSSGGGSHPFSGGDAAGLFSQGEGVGSALFSASGLYGGSSGAGHQGSGSPYQASSGGSSVFSLDGGALYGSSDAGSSPYFGGSRASAGDLYASGASPAASLYNPNPSEQGRGGYDGRKPPGSALYVSSSDSQRNAESSYPSAKESANSFNVDSSRHSPADSGPHSYSVAFQPSAQGGSGFQPVSFASDFQGKSS